MGIYVLPLRGVLAATAAAAAAARTRLASPALRLELLETGFPDLQSEARVSLCLLGAAKEVCEPHLL